MDKSRTLDDDYYNEDALENQVEDETVSKVHRDDSFDQQSEVEEFKNRQPQQRKKHK